MGKMARVNLSLGGMESDGSGYLSFSLHASSNFPGALRLALKPYSFVFRDEDLKAFYGALLIHSLPRQLLLLDGRGTLYFGVRPIW
jgi:hypothetical protein